MIVALASQPPDVVTVQVPGAGGEEEKPSPGTLAGQLAAARAQLSELELRMTPEHPDLMRVRRVVAELEEQVRRTTARVPVGAPQRASLTPNELRRSELEEEIRSIDRQLAQKAREEERLRGLTRTYQSRVDAAPSRETELIELMRDYGTLQQVYTGLLAKREESKVASNLERRQISEQFKVLDPPQVPQRPFTPNRPRITLMGAILGFLVGVALAALLEYRDSSLRTTEDVISALSLPVLAVIPIVATPAQERYLRFRRVGSSLVAVLMFVGNAAVVLWTFVS
jgi:uncharacterized protein involved in exopolysaccharide biosynthesis